MFAKVLVANRGEIALRIIRACTDLGIKTVAVYSEADSKSLHLKHADETVCIGPAASAKSYLNIEAIIDAVKKTGAEALHPGYGYLAENEDLAKRCEEEGIIFIGPTPQNLRMAGDKIGAKQACKAAGVPVVPSSESGVASVDEAVEISAQIGYPVMVKASGGGGGRGIRICHNEEMLREEFPVAKMEAMVGFGNDELYIEKYIVQPRHIEFQILADKYGNTIHLGERECSIQRRYQKLIEESPSPFVTPELRKKMGEAAIACAKAVSYVNAGTVEFLVDANRQFYFMEMNARIQVEHPVTEIVTGVDLVKQQLRIAFGEKLGFTYEDLPVRGWAIECRINAEDPERKFLPSPGKIATYQPPGGFGVRIDTHLYEGYELPMYYDSLLCKLIAFDLTRAGAINIMSRALKEFTIDPIKTTIPLHARIMNDPLYRNGTFDTSYIGKILPEDTDEDDD